MDIDCRLQCVLVDRTKSYDISYCILHLTDHALAWNVSASLKLNSMRDSSKSYLSREQHVGSNPGSV